LKNLDNRQLKLLADVGEDLTICCLDGLKVSTQHCIVT